MGHWNTVTIRAFVRRYQITRRVYRCTCIFTSVLMHYVCSWSAPNGLGRISSTSDKDGALFDRADRSEMRFARYVARYISPTKLLQRDWLILIACGSYIRRPRQRRRVRKSCSAKIAPEKEISPSPDFLAQTRTISRSRRVHNKNDVFITKDMRRFFLSRNSILFRALIFRVKKTGVRVLLLKL